MSTIKIESYYIKEKEYAANKLFSVNMCLATVAVLDVDEVFICGLMVHSRGLGEPFK